MEQVYFLGGIMSNSNSDIHLDNQLSSLNTIGKIFSTLTIQEQRNILNQLQQENPQLHQNILDEIIDEIEQPDKDIPIYDCVGCGYCCKHVQCIISVRIHGYQKVCPSLKWDGKRYRCDQAIEYKYTLGIGKGCCSPLHNSYRQLMIDGKGEQFDDDFYP